MSENNSGATTALFVVSLTAALSKAVSVGWKTADGTAKAGTDYVAASGTVTFEPGEVAKQIQVTVLGREPGTTDSRTFSILLDPPANAILDQQLTEVTINVTDEAGTPVTSLVVATGPRGLKGDPGLNSYELAKLQGFSGTLEEYIEQETAAGSAAERSEKSAENSSAQAIRSEVAAEKAESIVDAQGTYPSINAGLSGTTNGQYFRVFQDLTSPYAFNYYKNDNSTAVLIAKTVGNKVIYIDDTEDNEIVLVKDAAGNTVMRTDSAGEVYIPNMNDRSLQEEIERAGKLNNNIKIDSSPGILKLNDAQNNTMAIMDHDFGGYYLPGMDRQSLQDHLEKLRGRIDKMYKSRVIFDAWDDFGIDWNGNDRAGLYRKIQAALDYISSLPFGGSLWFRNGVYPLFSPLVPRNNVNIICERGARFMPVRGLSAFERRINSADLDLYLKDASFIDVEIDGSEQFTTGDYNSGIKGMYITGFSGCMFLRTYIHDTGATGMGIDFAHDSFILDGKFKGCGRLAPLGAPGASGIGIGSGALVDEPLIISRNMCEGNRNNGIFVEQQRLEFVKYRSRQIIVAENICTKNNHGFADCGAEGMIVTGNDFTDNLSHGVLMDTGTLTPSWGRPQPGVGGILANNQILRNGGCGVLYDAHAVSPGGGYTYSCNVLGDNGGDGYQFIGGSNVIPDISITGGKVAGNAGAAVNVVSGGMTDFDIDNVRMLKNGGVADIVLNGDVNVGTIWNNRFRPNGDKKAIAGTGRITKVDIANNQYTGTSAKPVDLTGVQTAVTYGRNPGL